MKLALIIGIQVVALYPAIHWYAVRTRYASEQRWELLALFAAGLLVAVRRCKAQERSNLALPTILTAAFALSVQVLPSLVSTWIAWAAFAASASVLFLGCRFDAPLFGLLTLSLPVLPVFQYHLSYPLRTLVAQVAAWMLRFVGVSVEREGACLLFENQFIWVDAPCSGLRMLWSALFLGMCLSAALRFSAGRTLRFAISAAVIVVMANILRTTSLFFVEAGLVEVPDWAHAGVGLGSYALAMCLLLVMGTRRKKPSCAELAVS